MSSVFSHSDYRSYIEEALQSSNIKGAKSKLSEFLGFHSAHLSQVLSGKSNLSLEHAFKMNEFFGHSEKEGECFLYLVEYGRAGSQELKSFFKNKLELLRQETREIQSRLKVQEKELSVEDQAIYYSDLVYGKAHVAYSLDGVSCVKALAKVLKVSFAKAQVLTEFLLRTNLAVKEGSQIKVGPGVIHLNQDSPFLKMLHQNHRLEVVKSLSEKTLSQDEVHYSVMYSVSEKDSKLIKEELLKTIKRLMKIVEPSPAETLFATAIDFYKLL